MRLFSSFFKLRDSVWWIICYIQTGIITYIPKWDKNKMYLKSWRPISLLNVTYTITSASIADRLKQVLDSIISEDQSGFLPGRH